MRCASTTAALHPQTRCRRPRPRPAKRLFDSHIFGPELMAVLDQLEVLQSKTHDLGTWLSIIAVPSAQPGDDPSGVGQRAFWVRVLLALRLAFKFSRKGRRR